MEDLIERAKSPEEINMLSPLTWAYVGDCIYELYIRTDLVNKTKLKPHKLHIETIKYVTADNIILSAKNNNKKINDTWCIDAESNTQTINASFLPSHRHSIASNKNADASDCLTLFNDTKYAKVRYSNKIDNAYTFDSL